MTVVRSIVLVGALAACLAPVSRAEAILTFTVDKCLASQLKIVGKGAAAALGCHAKAAAQGVATDPACLAKAEAKVEPALAKLDAKLACPVEGSGVTLTSDVTAFGASMDARIGHAAGKCDAAKTKVVAKYVAAVLGCYAKAAGKTGVLDQECTSAATAKRQAAIAKAETGDDCSHTSDVALENAARVFIEAATCTLDASNPACATTCGNGVSEPAEPCDASVGSLLWNACGPEFECHDCNCTCPTTVTFTPDASAPARVLDTGWTGIAHRARVLTDETVTLAMTCAAPGRPCGTCPVSGPVPNPLAGNGQIANARCTTNSARGCLTDADCAPRQCLGGPNEGLACGADSDCPSGTCPALGACAFYFGSTLPLAAGGVATCVANYFDGPVTGTVNVESGEAATTAHVVSRVALGVAIDTPCPRCVNDDAVNDSTHDGTCDGGPRANLSCDANGTVPDRPDFGATSLDCPPSPGAVVASLPIDLGNATAPVAKTLTAASPACSGPGESVNKCLCDTCNDAAAEPCASNADCPPSGGNPGICGGRRCIGGANVGAPCTSSSACPGGGICARSGEPTKPSACLDDTSVVNRDLECTDPDGDGEGACTNGPLDQTCSLASGHAQRGCTADDDCGGAAETCGAALRRCFLTGGGTFQPAGTSDGTDTLVAVGMADAPVRDASRPTLASVFCIAPTAAPAVNAVAGLPGPGRLVLEGSAVGHP